jgi:hypothetical protein
MTQSGHRLGRIPMAIKIKEVSSVNEAFRELEVLALRNSGDMAFRGHGDANWRLQSTLCRHTYEGFVDAIDSMDEMLDRFYSCLASLGKLPRERMSRRVLLEYARHYGVPSPLIDFSRSPYVALWMAFNGVRKREKEMVSVYALSVSGLGVLWRQHSKSAEAYEEFRRTEHSDIFEDGYSLNVLRLIERPSSWNTRMLRQQGLFVYDALSYGPKAAFKDLEDFIENSEDPQGEDGRDTFTLHKIVIPKLFVGDIFAKLELMGVDGTRLFDNHEGAVADVKNAYVFNPQSGYTHDRPWRKEE